MEVVVGRIYWSESLNTFGEVVAILTDGIVIFECENTTYPEFDVEYICLECSAFDLEYVPDSELYEGLS